MRAEPGRKRRIPSMEVGSARIRHKYIAIWCCEESRIDRQPDADRSTSKVLARHSPGLRRVSEMDMASRDSLPGRMTC
jgi:hypothetical protein